MLLCFLVALGGCWVAWLLLKGKTEWDALEAMGVTPVAELRPGEVRRVRGAVVVLEAPPRSPLQGKACVVARLVVTVDGRELREELAVPFGVQDGTGTVRVVPARWEAMFASGSKQAPAPGAPLPAAVKRLVDAQAPGATPTHWTEELLSPGEAVTVHGAVGPAAGELHAPEGGTLRLCNVARLARQ
ncbi:MAG: hypothetical protein FJ086_20320 [Deltaproteobacteria bacterium]|nr:hypothetical protein [Deltaproteobacteria bacterium]